MTAPTVLYTLEPSSVITSNVWVVWNQIYGVTACATSGASVSYQCAWTAWNQAYSGASNVTTTSQAWVVWNLEYDSVTAVLNSPVPVQGPSLTPEQIAEQQRLNLAAETRRKAREEARKEAARKAQALLLENLDRKQRAQFASNRHFIVHSADGQRRYQIEYGTASWNYRIRHPSVAASRSNAGTAETCFTSRLPAARMILAESLCLAFMPCIRLFREPSRYGPTTSEGPEQQPRRQQQKGT